MALNPLFMIAPGPQWVFVDPSTGEPLANGFVYCYKDNARSTLKPAYTLIGGVGTYEYSPLPNPIPLSGGGTATDGVGNDIFPYMYPYDADGNIELYYLVIKDADGNTKETRQAWPNIVDSTPVTNNFTYNYMRNSQFYSWSNGIDYNAVKTGSVDDNDFFVDDWAYFQEDSGQAIEIKQGIYTTGENSVPTNSPFYLIYKNTGGTAGASYNYFLQTFKSVETLQGQPVAIEIWARKSGGGVAGPISVSAEQNFGSGGGSGLYTTTLFTIPSLTASWQKYTGTGTIPSTVGKTIGTGEDDELTIQLNMPLNLPAEIHIGSIRLEKGTDIAGTQIVSNDQMQQETNTFALYPPFSTGDVKFTLKNAADIGWLLMDDGTIGNPSSNSTHALFSCYALFSLIWNNILNVATPGPSFVQLYDSSHMVVAKGANANADWEANRQLSLTRQLGRVISGRGAFAVTMPFTVDTSSEELTVIDTTSLLTGTPITVTTTDTLPSPLLIATTYYVINVDSTTIQLAASLTDATDGIAINLTTTGNGINSLNATASDWSLGFNTGAEMHQLQPLEMPSHQHGVEGGGNFIIDNGSSPQYGSSGTATGRKANTALTGGSNLFSIIQPTVFMNVMIKL